MNRLATQLGIGDHGTPARQDAGACLVAVPGVVAVGMSAARVAMAAGMYLAAYEAAARQVERESRRFWPVNPSMN